MTATIDSVAQYRDGTLLIHGSVDGTPVVAVGDVTRLDRHWDESVKVQTPDGRTIIPETATQRAKTVAEVKAYFERLLEVQLLARSTGQMLKLISAQTSTPVATSEQHPMLAAAVPASAPVAGTTGGATLTTNGVNLNGAA